MNVRYRVELNQEERDQLTRMLSGGRHAACKLKRAHVLLAADAGESDEAIAANVSVGGSTVYRTKRRFVLGNLDAALSEAPRPGAERKLSGRQEALLVATACAKPPQGRARWTLDLLAGEMVKVTEHGELSRETVRRRLAENDLKPWRREMWCIPRVDGAYVARMEDVLDLDAEAPDPQRPVVCFDESPTQLIGEVRQPIPAEPGKPERYDYEYSRKGTANLFVFLNAHHSWRDVKITDQRTATDGAGDDARNRGQPPSARQLRRAAPVDRRSGINGTISDTITVDTARLPLLYDADNDDPRMAGEIAARLAECTERWAAAGLDVSQVNTSSNCTAEWFRANRTPVRKGMVTESPDGRSVCAVLMGGFTDPDMGTARANANTNFWCHANVDHAHTVRITPGSPTRTAVRGYWLVDATAIAGKDYDPERIAAFHHEVMSEDWEICRQQWRGITSPAYEPGPYSPNKEQNVMRFVAWYLRQMAA